jgi:NTP pyrophosphatase (non-canonical NTP hydrolase)
MQLNDYQREAYRSSRIDWDDAQSRHVPTLGLLGELGSLAGEKKKIIRDGAAYTDGRVNLQAEFGDVLWYIAALATQSGIFLSEATTQRVPTSRLEMRHIYRLASAVEVLASTAQQIFPIGVRSRDVLHPVVTAALSALLDAISAEELDLAEVCRLNIAKGEGYFGGTATGPAHAFDCDYPAHERLPRRIDIHVLELARGPGKVEVILRANDLNIGDRLTDNAKNDDGYRFHDAFHLAYVAVLGWSPVSRGLFRCKRKSNSAADEVEDGARAAIVEETITHTMWDYARGVSMLENVERIDHNILTLIQHMVRGLEVGGLPLCEWQRAFIVGFEAFRQLRSNGGGWLRLDASTRSLDFYREQPPSDSVG